jgi:hypothetical protein
MLFLVSTVQVFSALFVNFASVRYHRQVIWKFWILQMYVGDKVWPSD